MSHEEPPAMRDRSAPGRGGGSVAPSGSEEIRDPDELGDLPDGTGSSIADALRALLEPPDDIEHRVADTVSEQLTGRSVGGIAADLVGLGARTLALFLTEGDPPADWGSDVGDEIDRTGRSRT